MTTAVCNRTAFEPFRRLVTGPFLPEDLADAERFVRAVVLHDDLRMLPERFRITVDAAGYSTVSPLLAQTNGFEYFGDYMDPSFVEKPEARELLENATTRDSRGFFFDPYGVSVILAIQQVRIGGSAVVRDSEWEIEVVRAREQTIERKRHRAEWETRLAHAEEYPELLFSQLDESWRRFAKKVAQGGFDLRIPPVLGIVMSRSARRDAIPAVLLDLRNEWASAREKLWHRVDSLRNPRSVNEAEQILVELEAASKLFSREPTDYDTQPMRVFWDIAAAAAAGAGVASATPMGPVGGAVTGAMGGAARSLPKLFQELGPVLFGRGAFDLAKRVRKEVGMVEPGVLRRLLSPSEQQAFGIK
jgi:hypothetical protein